LPLAQSALEWQVVSHVSLPPGQRYGAHPGVRFGLLGWSAAICVHVPGVATQVSQAPAHAVLQQTPSTHCPLAQRAAALHGWPRTSVH
jgi:hypothetical protein